VGRRDDGKGENESKSYFENFVSSPYHFHLGLLLTNILNKKKHGKVEPIFGLSKTKTFYIILSKIKTSLQTMRSKMSMFG